MSHLLHGSNQINTFVSSFELFFKNKKIRSFKFIKSSKNTSNDQKNSSNEKVQINLHSSSIEQKNSSINQFK